MGTPEFAVPTLEALKNSNNENAKTAIRKSKTPLEALDNYLIIWKESN